MEKLTDKRKINATIFLFTMTYLVSYMTRINLGAVITAVVEDTETKPTVYTGTYNATSHITLYAVYSYVEGGTGAAGGSGTAPERRGAGGQCQR